MKDTMSSSWIAFIKWQVTDDVASRYESEVFTLQAAQGRVIELIKKVTGKPAKEIKKLIPASVADTNILVGEKLFHYRITENIEGFGEDPEKESPNPEL